MKRLPFYLFIAAALGWVAYIHIDAYQCWRNGGKPVASLGFYVCVK
jgi:hypothetical protein